MNHYDDNSLQNDDCLSHRMLAEARSWIGTRFQHQGRVKKTAAHRGGVDCLGLLVGIAAALNLRGRDEVRLADLDSLAYGHRPDGEALRLQLERWLMPVERLQPADIVLCDFDRNPQHLALVSDYTHGGLGLVHAHAKARAVVEHRLDDEWEERVVRGYRVLRSQTCPC